MGERGALRESVILEKDEDYHAFAQGALTSTTRKRHHKLWKKFRSFAQKRGYDVTQWNVAAICHFRLAKLHHHYAPSTRLTYWQSLVGALMRRYQTPAPKSILMEDTFKRLCVENHAHETKKAPPLKVQQLAEILSQRLDS
jgi:hypothetical protein